MSLLQLHHTVLEGSLPCEKHLYVCSQVYVYTHTYALLELVDISGIPDTVSKRGAPWPGLQSQKSHSVPMLMLCHPVVPSRSLIKALEDAA